MGERGGGGCSVRCCAWKDARNLESTAATARSELRIKATTIYRVDVVLT